MRLNFLAFLVFPLAAEVVLVDYAQSHETPLMFESVYAPWHKTAVLSHQTFFGKTHANEGEAYVDFKDGGQLPSAFTWINSFQSLPQQISGRSQRGDLEITMVIDLLNRSFNLYPTHLKMELVTTEKGQSDWVDVTAGSTANSKRTIYAFFDSVFKTQDHQFEFLVGYKENQPVVSCVIYYEEDCAGIYWVGTLPNERRQGFGTAVMVHALERVKRRGIRWVVLQAQPKGVGVYQSLGFIPIGYLAGY